jgi:hypothetical protein
MGREDLIGNGKRHLIPAWQPKGTGSSPEGSRVTKKASKAKVPKRFAKAQRRKPKRVR